MGMYLFLASEIMLFGGLFAGDGRSPACSIRQKYVGASRDMHLWIGGVNTLVLLTSSLFAALGGRGRPRGRGAADRALAGADRGRGPGLPGAEGRRIRDRVSRRPAAGDGGATSR